MERVWVCESCTCVCEFQRILECVCISVCEWVCGWQLGGRHGPGESSPSNWPFGRWQFQTNSHPASQWPWPPNISITSSSTSLPQPVTHRREGRLHSSQHAYTHSSVLSPRVHNIPQTSVRVCPRLFPCSWGKQRRSLSGWEEDRFRRDTADTHCCPQTSRHSQTTAFRCWVFLHILNRGGNVDRPLDHGEQSVWCLWSGSVPLWSEMESEPCS